MLKPLENFKISLRATLFLVRDNKDNTPDFLINRFVNGLIDDIKKDVIPYYQKEAIKNQNDVQPRQKEHTMSFDDIYEDGYITGYECWCNSINPYSQKGEKVEYLLWEKGYRDGYKDWVLDQEERDDTE